VALKVLTPAGRKVFLLLFFQKKKFFLFTVPDIRLQRLTLTDFRSYKAVRFSPAARLCVLTGANGSGKTNLLEAVSLLVPGRGLRGAKFSELARQGQEASGSWAVAATVQTVDGPCEIGTGNGEDQERRVFRLDGAAPRSQAEVGVRLAAVWLTPQMDRLFTEAAAGRRKFLDRLVVALEPGHAREVAAFEAASAQRNRLLAEGNADPDWLAGLEDSMARHAVAATATRLALVGRLNTVLAAGVAAPFPAVGLTLDCEIAARLAAAPALAVEGFLRESLAGARAADAARGAASLGPQRADVLIADAATGRAASQSSTGQQKSMLIGIILGHAALIAAARGAAPILLLDEPLVHLDEAHRLALFAALIRQGLHALLTGTDAAPFRPLEAAYYEVSEGRIDLAL
jgi:DNA replication and repair protein RecF